MCSAMSHSKTTIALTKFQKKRLIYTSKLSICGTKHRKGNELQSIKRPCSML